MAIQLWECINYKKFADNKPFCDKGHNLEKCSGDCQNNITLAEWREFIKTIPLK